MLYVVCKAVGIKWATLASVSQLSLSASSRPGPVFGETHKGGRSEHVPALRRWLGVAQRHTGLSWERVLVVQVGERGPDRATTWPVSLRESVIMVT